MNMLLQKHCRHEWKITHLSNVIQQDHMGYPIMLCIQKCSKCGKSKQAWIDVLEPCTNEKTGKYVLLKWQEIE